MPQYKPNQNLIDFKITLKEDYVKDLEQRINKPKNKPVTDSQGQRIYNAQPDKISLPRRRHSQTIHYSTRNIPVKKGIIDKIIDYILGENPSQQKKYSFPIKTSNSKTDEKPKLPIDEAVKDLEYYLAGFLVHPSQEIFINYNQTTDGKYELIGRISHTILERAFGAELERHLDVEDLEIKDKEINKKYEHTPFFTDDGERAIFYWSIKKQPEIPEQLKHKFESIILNNSRSDKNQENTHGYT